MEARFIIYFEVTNQYDYIILYYDLMVDSIIEPPKIIYDNIIIIFFSINILIVIRTLVFLL